MTLDTPAARLAALYDPEFVRAAGHRLAELLGDHFRAVQNRETAVLNWRHPEDNIVDAGRMLDAASALPVPFDPEAVASRFSELVTTALSRGQNLHSPRYVGHQVPPPVPIAGLFDAVSAATNQPMAIYEMGPWATAIESALIERLGARLGYEPEGFAGFVTHGGSIANLTALLTARNVALGDVWETGLSGRPAPVIVAHAESHYCISRSAGILGIGTQQVVKTALDEQRRMNPQALDRSLAELRESGTPVIAVVACACATPIGAFDQLEPIADVCNRHNVWLHVDAAHGGSVVFSEKHRHLVAGIERADSVVWDAHKMMHMPALCTFVFYKNREHRYEAFRQEAPYLFDPSEPGLAEHDSGLKTLECTKCGAAFELWGVWSLFGDAIFGDLVEAAFDLGRTLYEKLAAADDFQPLHEPQCNIVAFRHVPAELRNAPPNIIGRFQLDLRREVVRNGAFYLVPSSKDGVAALRCTLMNPLTTPDDLDDLLRELRTRGRRLFEARQASSSVPPA